jgi:hypothetical protein
MMSKPLRDRHSGTKETSRNVAHLLEFPQPPLLPSLRAYHDMHAIPKCSGLRTTLITCSVGVTSLDSDEIDREHCLAPKLTAYLPFNSGWLICHSKL